MTTPQRPTRPVWLRVLADGLNRLWHQHLLAHEVYLSALQPWHQKQPRHEPLHWRRRGRDWRLHGDTVPAHSCQRRY